MGILYLPNVKNVLQIHYNRLQLQTYPILITNDANIYSNCKMNTTHVCQ